MILELEKLDAKQRSQKKSPSKKISANGSKTANAKPKSYIVIDHPNNGEKLQSVHYAVRIGAGGWKEGTPVEICIDDGPWALCRHNSGYFWYDWQPVLAGSHAITARMKLPNNKFKKSAPIQVTA